LPDVEKQIAKRYRELGVELTNLGKPPSDHPTSALLGLLTDLEAVIAKHVEGQPDHEGFMQAVNELAHAFSMDIKETKPNFRSKGRKTPGTDKDTLTMIMLDPNEKMYLDDMPLHIKG
jgi:hypothetical protein